MAYIKVVNASKYYADQKVLDSVDLEFESRKIYGIVGRNGSGKTLLLKAIIGFLMLDEGYVESDHNVIGKDIDFIQNTGFIIETPGFLGSETGFKNLKSLANIRGLVGDEEIKKAIKLVGLDPELEKNVSAYSMGMKQRLAIAQAIMEDPEILLLDEPMNGLDNQAVEKMRELFLSLKEKGKLIIICSHNKEDIEILCDEIIRVDKGKVFV